MNTKRGPAVDTVAGWTTGAAMAITLVGVTSATTGCSRAAPGDDPTAVAAATASLAAPAATAPAAIEPQPGFVRLARSAHPLARPELDAGRVEPERRISNLSLFFKLTPEQRRQRDALAAAQLDRSSPLYHQWLTPETYRARFGAAPADVARATSWLAKQGLEVHRTSPLGTRVTFSGTAAQLEAAFQTELHYYRVAGEKHYAMATAPAIPEALADSVLSLYNTHDFVPRPASRRLNAGAAARRAEVSGHYQVDYDAGPDASGTFDLLGPPDWATAYDVAKLYSPGIGGKALDGTGVTVGIVGTAPIAQSDIDAFRTRFGLPATTVKMTLVPNTGAPSTLGFGGGIEAILDVEWSGGVAKGASIDYVYVGADDFNVDDATFYLIEENLAPVVSESYGGCEAGELPSDADVIEVNGTAANLMGITYMAAAGDDGAADCGSGFGGQVQTGLYVDLPGAFPGVTSVGGTQFPSPLWSAQGNLLDAGLEQVWNESNNPYSTYGVGAGGGGISSLFTRPAYQGSAAACTPVGSLPTASPGPMRQVPDLVLSAASATPGYFIECTFVAGMFGGDDCSGTGGSPEGTAVGGTSASSPSFAGIVAILDQATGERLGNINPMLYELAASSSASSVFHDIVSGNNEVVCGPGASDAGGPTGGDWPDAGCGAAGLYGYAAIPGYDCASGNGSVDAYNLVSAWLGATPTETVLVPSPTITSEGDTVTLTATVDVKGTNPNPVGGAVTFMFQSYGADCANDLSWEARIGDNHRRHRLQRHRGAADDRSAGAGDPGAAAGRPRRELRRGHAPPRLAVLEGRPELRSRHVRREPSHARSRARRRHDVLHHRWCDPAGALVHSRRHDGAVLDERLQLLVDRREHGRVQRRAERRLRPHRGARQVRRRGSRRGDRRLAHRLAAVGDRRGYEPVPDRRRLPRCWVERRRRRTGRRSRSGCLRRWADGGLRDPCRRRELRRLQLRGGRHLRRPVGRRARCARRSDDRRGSPSPMAPLLAGLTRARHLRQARVPRAGRARGRKPVQGARRPQRRRLTTVGASGHRARSCGRRPARV